MGIIDRIFTDELPEFDLGYWYYNSDYDGEIRVLSRSPFLVQFDYREEPVPCSRDLYRQKLADGIIFKNDA